MNKATAPTRPVPSNDASETPQPASSKSAPTKVLLVNGKCSEIFRSALENSVEDCILQYADENAVYVAKSGQAIPLPAGNAQHSVLSLREQSANMRQSAKSGRRRNSINLYNPLPQLGSARSNTFPLPVTALAATTATRMRHQLVQQKFSLEDDIFEETTIEQFPSSAALEAEEQVILPSIAVEEDSPSTGQRVTSHAASPVRLSQPAIPSRKSQLTYRDRQKSYRLSDLVMLGPEYFSHVFNLPRPIPAHRRSLPRTQTRSSGKRQQQQRNKTAEKYDELDEIKQDLFHRYLWTQKPQVSCRICPLSSYTRSATFAI